MKKKIAFLLTAMSCLTVVSTGIVKADAIIEPDEIIGKLQEFTDFEKDEEGRYLFHYTDEDDTGYMEGWTLVFTDKKRFIEFQDELVEEFFNEFFDENVYRGENSFCYDLDEKNIFINFYEEVMWGESSILYSFDNEEYTIESEGEVYDAPEEFVETINECGITDMMILEVADTLLTLTDSGECDVASLQYKDIERFVSGETMSVSEQLSGHYMNNENFEFLSIFLEEYFEERDQCEAIVKGMGEDGIVWNAEIMDIDEVPIQITTSAGKVIGLITPGDGGINVEWRDNMGTLEWYEKISNNEAYGHEIYDYNEIGAEALKGKNGVYDYTQKLSGYYDWKDEGYPGIARLQLHFPYPVKNKGNDGLAIYLDNFKQEVGIVKRKDGMRVRDWEFWDDIVEEPDEEGTVCVIGELCYVGEEEHDNERIPVFELVKAEPFY